MCYVLCAMLYVDQIGWDGSSCRVLLNRVSRCEFLLYVEGFSFHDMSRRYWQIEALRVAGLTLCIEHRGVLKHIYDSKLKNN